MRYTASCVCVKGSPIRYVTRKQTERITRRHTPWEVRPFRVYGGPREAVFIGMCTSLSCQTKKTKVTQARLELATVWLQVVRYRCATPAAQRSVWNSDPRRSTEMLH